MKEITPVDEKTVTTAIIERGAKTLLDLVKSDVIIAGAGPSGLAAAKYLAKGGLKTIVIERRLSFGGGIGGGGMLLPRIVVQRPSQEILQEVGVKLEPYAKGIWVVDVAESMAKLAAGAIDANAKIILGITVDDLIVKRSRVCGAVLQWSAVNISGLHVDPLAVESRAVVDCTGHDAEVIAIASRKNPDLKISVPGERSMDAVSAERRTVECTGEVIPGLWVAGMAAAAVKQGPRMGPIFGGMLLSGRKVAEEIMRSLLKR
jgi:thiazole biosynthesis enzyme